MIDLHTHSTASDGTYSPAQLVEYAKSKHITTMALTDHDCVDGILEAQKAAAVHQINFIPGIELSIDWPTGEFHLLGLGLKTASPELKSAINYLKEERRRRNIKMTEKLAEQGVILDYDEVVSLAGNESIGRPHFAQLMVNKGIVRTKQQAFDRYFAKGRPCYVEKCGLNLSNAVKAIKTSQGIPVHAHPLSIYVSWGKIEDTMIGIQNEGVMGLEAWHPGVRISEAQRLVELAHKLDMFATAGSDFHGEKTRADRKIGFSAGGLKIKDIYWEEELQPALEKAHKGSNHEFLL